MSSSEGGATTDGTARIEVPADVVMFSAYGAVLFVGCQLQHVLGEVYAMHFEDPRDGSLPRVDEKARKAFDATLGTAKTMALPHIPEELRLDIEIAVDLRNYIAHELPLRTRTIQGTPDGLEGLAERLNITRRYFSGLIDSLQEHLKQHVMTISGRSRAEVEAHCRPWDQLGDPFDEAVIVPEAEENIVRGWYSRTSSSGPRYYLENARGVLWQFADNGLAHARIEAPGRDWTPWHTLTTFLPATVRSRPSPKGGRFRSSFNYDLCFSTGATLVISKSAGGNAIEWQILDKQRNPVT